MVKDLENFNHHDVNDAVESCDGEETRSRNSKDKRPSRRSFPSNVQGHFIVNAVTGVAYPWKVGSVYEDLLWKVCDSSARRGKLDPDFYFYDSPKQAIDHRRYKQDAFSEDTLKWWKARVAKMTKMLKEEEEDN
jgi:hypothetical protein